MFWKNGPLLTLRPWAEWGSCSTQGLLFFSFVGNLTQTLNHETYDVCVSNVVETLILFSLLCAILREFLVGLGNSSEFFGCFVKVS